MGEHWVSEVEGLAAAWRGQRVMAGHQAAAMAAIEEHMEGL